MIGVGGGGGNAVNRMIASDVAGLSFGQSTRMPSFDSTADDYKLDRS